jgi:tetrapyrrole methylase family protein/MazG family protein
MLSYMHQEQGLFSVAEALAGVSEKLIRRHPHVFGDLQVTDSQQVLDNWARIKVEQEGRNPKDSRLDQVSQALPPLDRAYKLQKQAAKAGFDWPSLDPVVRKVEEELGEVTQALASPGQGTDAAVRDAVEAELGDLLFSVVNLCRFLQVEPSVALQRTNATFTKRFKHVEKRMRETAQEMRRENLADMEGFWEEAKKQAPGRWPS